jgi:poly(A) polymerase
MAMSARDEFAMAGLCKRLKVSNNEKTRLLGWASDRTVISPNMDERTQKQAVYASSPQIISDRAIIRAAGTDDPLMASRWLTLASFAAEWEIPVFPLKGRDLKSAGVSDGPQMGKMLEALKALWIKSGFTANKERLLMALALINRA